MRVHYKALHWKNNGEQVRADWVLDSCDMSNGMGSGDTCGSCEGVEDPKCMGSGDDEASEKECVYIRGGSQWLVDPGRIGSG